MFTGIIEAVGKVESVSPAGETAAVEIESAGLDLSDVAIGDSIAVNGVCLTVKHLGARSIGFDVSAETLRLDMVDLVERGVLLKIGSKKGTHYILK